MNDIPAAVTERFLPEALDFLRRLVAVNSGTGHREGIARNADIVAGQFASLGFHPEQVPATDEKLGSHLFLRRSGPSTGLLLVTHLDTVFSEEEERNNHFAWYPEGERIYGPGVIDNKGGTAMIWLILATLQAVSPEVFEATDWLIAANAAEEELVPDFPERCGERLPENCRAALVFESCGGQSEGFSLVRCRKGSVNLRIIAEGRGAHAGSRHHEGANAIVALSHVVPRIAALTDYSRNLTVNVGRISGGGPINRVPHQAACEVNIRAFDEIILQGAVEAINELVAAPSEIHAVSDGFACRLRVETLSRNPAWPAQPATDTLIATWQNVASRLGIDLDVESRGGLSDGNYLSRFLPVLDGLGPFGRNGHASERSADGLKVPEYVVPASFSQLARVHVAAIRELLTP
jgi:glutamate carboxypeptidase